MLLTPIVETKVVGLEPPLGAGAIASRARSYAQGIACGKLYVGHDEACPIVVVGAADGGQGIGGVSDLAHLCINVLVAQAMSAIGVAQASLHGVDTCCEAADGLVEVEASDALIDNADEAAPVGRGAVAPCAETFPT